MPHVRVMNIPISNCKIIVIIASVTLIEKAALDIEQSAMAFSCCRLPLCVLNGSQQLGPRECIIWMVIPDPIIQKIDDRRF